MGIILIGWFRFSIDQSQDRYSGHVIWVDESGVMIFTLDTSGDQIQAGDTELTLILNLARSRAMFLVRMFTAPLLAE